MMKSPQRFSSGFSTILLLVQSEYLEMPGLVLTEAQARRLWNLMVRDRYESVRNTQRRNQYE